MATKIQVLILAETDGCEPVFLLHSFLRGPRLSSLSVLFTFVKNVSHCIELQRILYSISKLRLKISTKYIWTEASVPARFLPCELHAIIGLKASVPALLSTQLLHEDIFCRNFLHGF